ncbi:DUF4468 domain-containing protein [Sphingobacterium spiritivorum]|uniref:DUF4468 domain-containing protein n=1 Tax=Sphingobacterium spiritivorum TaxID=258 RepID=UPI003DA4F6D0
MNKTILLILMIITGNSLKAQEVPEIPFVDGEVVYTEVVESNLNKDELYRNAKSWIASYFISSKDVIDLQDQEAGKIIGKAILKPKLSYLGQSRHADVNISFQIDCKDGKYRYIIKVLDYYHAQTAQSIPELIEIAHGRKKTLTNTKSYAKKQIEGLSNSINDLIISLKKNILINDDF